MGIRVAGGIGCGWVGQSRVGQVEMGVWLGGMGCDRLDEVWVGVVK